MTAKQSQAEQVKAMRDAILARATINNDTGAVTIADGELGLYEGLIPEGLTADTIKAVHGFETNFIAAVAGAGVELATSAYKTNSDLTTVSFEVPMHGRDKVQIMADRSSGLNVAVVSHATNPKAGHLKSVFAEFNAAMDALAAA